MSRSTKRVAVIVALALLAGLALVTNTSPAASQAPADPVPPTLHAITLPEGYTPPAQGPGAVSRAYAGTGAEVGTVSTNDGFEGQPLGAESVIGADGRMRVNPTTDYPARAIGQIEGFDNEAGGFTCTGWLIDANTILTSGHCLYPPGTSLNNTVESLEFFPGRNRNVDPYGSCSAVSGWSPTAWIQSETPNADYAIIQLDCNIGDTVGWFGLFSLPGAGDLLHRRARVQGYPGDHPFGTHSGMSGRIERSQAKMVFYDIDTAGGQSGSPVWWTRASCGGPCGMAVHSYGVGIQGLNLNAAARFTTARFAEIVDIADNNDV